jgi:predicted ferric reductase
MKAAAWAGAGLLGLLAVLWGWAAWPAWAMPWAFWPWRQAGIQGSGLLAITAMSGSLILATRPVWLEPALGGLDKMYRLHKWLGIAALGLGTSHWLLAQAGGWSVDLGWAVRPARGPHAVATTPVLGWFQQQRGLAEGLGEWACYAALLLLVLALFKRFPYRLFFRTHRLLAVAYLVLVFHGVVLMAPAYWDQAIGWAASGLMMVGSMAALTLLPRWHGHLRRAVAVVERVTLHPSLGLVEVALQLKSPWRGHAAGQFAFLRFDTAEGPHPFTITSAWEGDGRLRFLIKALGDYTRTLARQVVVGRLVTVEGPYGQFNFAGSAPRQIWVAGGIGITPFLARMKLLAQAPDGKAIDLFHSTTEDDPVAASLLTAEASAAGVNLHRLVDDRDGRLDVARICELVPQWPLADLWFCGPAAFGQAMRAGFLARGMRAPAFHQELFEMR